MNSLKIRIIMGVYGYIQYCAVTANCSLLINGNLSLKNTVCSGLKIVKSVSA